MLGLWLGLVVLSGWIRDFLLIFAVVLACVPFHSLGFRVWEQETFVVLFVFAGLHEFFDVHVSVNGVLQ